MRGVSRVPGSVLCLFLPEHKMQSSGLREQESNLSYNNQHLDPVEIFQTCISITETCPTARHTPPQSEHDVILPKNLIFSINK